jgi:hypothetical protein
MSEKENNQPKYLPQRYCKKNQPSSYHPATIQLPFGLDHGPFADLKIDVISSPGPQTVTHPLLNQGFLRGISSWYSSPWIKKILTTSVRELL